MSEGAGQRLSRSDREMAQEMGLGSDGGASCRDALRGWQNGRSGAVPDHPKVAVGRGALGGRPASTIKSGPDPIRGDFGEVSHRCSDTLPPLTT